MTAKKSRHSPVAIIFVLAAPALIAFMLIHPAGRELLLARTVPAVYVAGFFKFALLAQVGEILALAVAAKTIVFPRGAFAKAVIWGIIGVAITLMMPVYYAGIQAAQSQGLLPGEGSAFVTALLASTVINCTFGFAMMAFHRVSDYMIEHWRESKGHRISRAARSIDWAGFTGFVVLRTLPFFWIPAHTVTFMLPTQYRVILSAALSIVLGLLLALAKRR